MAHVRRGFWPVPQGLGLPAICSVVRRSIQLSYGCLRNQRFFSGFPQANLDCGIVRDGAFAPSGSQSGHQTVSKTATSGLPKDHAKLHFNQT